MLLISLTKFLLQLESDGSEWSRMLKKWAIRTLDGQSMRPQLTPSQTVFLLMQIAAWLVSADAVTASPEARHGETAITCTNTVSGVSWQVKIDYDKSTVDSNPARISETQISWHDATGGGNYALDRKTGKLTVVFASSTAGHFIYDQCGLED